MQKLAVKIILLLILVLASVVILVLLPRPENNYNLAIIDKHKIISEIKSPKIVLVGGSNLAFGIDSTVIQKEFGVPVVNMGVHAGFGLGRMLDDVSPFLNRGDVLIVVPEYDQFTGTWNGGMDAFSLIFGAKQYRLLFSSRYELPSGFSQYLSRYFTDWVAALVRKSNSSIVMYTRDGFNENGDYVKHLEMNNRSFSPMKTEGFNQADVNNFFLIVNEFTEMGIRVLLSYPSYEELSFLNSADFIKKLDGIFRVKNNLQVISVPRNYCFQTNYFYDGAYHLNSEGRDIRTKQLIRDLQTSGIIIP